ncbi:MAG TPA: hypothetical protein VHR35_08815 [Nocardioides sp.]|nr:hypothetical protein [Nocardioides sp.]
MSRFDRLVEGRRNWLRLPELTSGHGDVVEFLREQVATGEVLLHGSNSRTVERFEPREQTSYRGVPVRAVFATPDPVWPLFFATTDTARADSRWNMCLLPQRSGAARTRYFFSVGAPPDGVWCDGAVYLLPRAAFTPSDEPSEWVATRAVDPVAVVPVTPAAFPFRHLVFRHVATEPEWRHDLRLVLAGARSRLGRRPA